MTARPKRRGRKLPDGGIIDYIAVEIAAGGTRPVALTHAERQLAAARILAGGGTPYVVSKRLGVSGSTALALARPMRASRPESSGVVSGRTYGERITRRHAPQNRLHHQVRETGADR